MSVVAASRDVLRGISVDLYRLIVPVIRENCNPQVIQLRVDLWTDSVNVVPANFEVLRDFGVDLLTNCSDFGPSEL